MSEKAKEAESEMASETKDTAVQTARITGIRAMDSFRGPRGEKGEPGERGEKGDRGEQGEPGKAGADGTPGSLWYSGTGITGTDPEGQRFETSDVRYFAYVNDRYLNTETFNIYRCTVSGATAVARWAYEGCIKGADGTPGMDGTPGADGAPGTDGRRGSMWFSGTGVSGVSMTPAAFPGSGVEEAQAGDCYLNTSYGYIYVCASGGDANTATWAYKLSARGAAGTPGSLWYSGTGITGTDRTGQRFQTSDVTYYANVDDRYLNTETFNIYRCTASGSAKVARWAYEGCLMGRRGTLWHSGTGVTGADTSAKVFPESGVDDALEGDFYLNTDDGHVFRCALGGDASTATWVYTMSLGRSDG